MREGKFHRKKNKRTGKILNKKKSEQLRLQRQACDLLLLEGLKGPLQTCTIPQI